MGSLKVGRTMVQENPNIEAKVLDMQAEHWERVFSNNSDMLGTAPSESARYAADLFEKEGGTEILELGGGQGRDTVFFAQRGFRIQVLDYTESGVRAINQKAQDLGLSNSVSSMRHDVREPLPLDDESFDNCYSHMLFSMALTTSRLKFLAEEVRRVLKPGGLCVYTVRNTKDAHYKAGVHRGEDMYESDGFIVHFFSKRMVRRLSKGYDLVDVTEFEEGELPRRLFRVTLRKRGD